MKTTVDIDQATLVQVLEIMNHHLACPTTSLAQHMQMPTTFRSQFISLAMERVIPAQIICTHSLNLKRTTSLPTHMIKGFFQTADPSTRAGKCLVLRGVSKV